MPKQVTPKPDARPSRPVWASDLNDEEFKFVTEYLVDFNGSAAVRRMGIAENWVREKAYELVHKPHVARAIDRAIIEDASGPRQWMLGRLRTLSDANVLDFFDIDVNGVWLLRPKKDLPIELQRCVKRIVRTKDGEIRLEVHDPLRAMEIFAKVANIALGRDAVAMDGETLAEMVLATEKLVEKQRAEKLAAAAKEKS